MAKPPIETRPQDALLDVPTANSKGLIPVLLVILGLAVLAAPFAIPIREVEIIYGKVINVGWVSKGSSPTVLAAIDGTTVWLRIPHRGMCGIGDRIEVYRRQPLIGPRRYQAGNGVCSG